MIGIQVEHVASTPGADTVEERTPWIIAQQFGYSSREARGTIESAATIQEDQDVVRNDGMYFLPGPSRAFERR